MTKTIISWATYTHNVVSGCSKPIVTDSEGKRHISPECERCYAEALSLKRGWSQKPWTGPNAAENVHLKPHKIAELKKIPMKPVTNPPSERQRVFICSMGDIFHDLVPDSFLHQLFDTMAAVPHIYQILTKRIERAAKWPGPWPDHVWLGTTCGHPMTKYRIDHLRNSNAKVRFISIEPLLSSLRPINLAGIHQVLIGGESGSGYRKMDMEWARELRDQCVAEGVAYLHKQDSAFRTETRCYIVEKDGSCWVWRQFPGELSPPVRVEPDNEKYHRATFPILV